MKKISVQIILLLIITFVIVNPMKVFAQTINVDGTDVTITFGERWHVCTRDNPVCCYEVEALGMTEEYMSVFFYENAIYLNAGIIADFDNDGMDFFIIKDKTDFCENLSTLTDEEMDAVVQEFADTVDCEVCEVYEGNHRFVHMEYVEDNVNYIKYVTVYNSEYYTFVIQKANAYTTDEKKDIYEIMESVVFGKPVSEDDIPTKYIWIGIACAVVVIGAISTIIIVRNNKKIKGE